MKNAFIRALCAAFCAVTVISSAGTYASAGAGSITDKQQQLEEIRRKNEERRQQLALLGGDISENEQAIKLASDQIEGLISEILLYGQLISEQEQDINDKKAEIAEVEAKISADETAIAEKTAKAAELDAQNKANLERFGKLARYMYMNNMSSQIPVLNGSDNWYDYYVYSSVINNITKQNADFMDEINASIEKQQQMITELNDEIAQLDEEKAGLEIQKAELEAQQAELEAAMTSIKADAEAKRAEINALAAKNDALAAQAAGIKTDIADAEKLEEEINAEIEELIRQAQANRDPEMPDYSGDGLRWPLDPQHHRITTYFGYSGFHGGHHSGIDVSDGGIVGAPIYAAQSGVVVRASNTCTHNEGKEGWTCGCGGNYGNYIIIDHGGSLATLYGHCQAIYVYEGQSIEKGQVIGEVGSTGWSTWWHLHFETRLNGSRVNPLDYVS